jgi:hypothetical protein
VFRGEESLLSEQSAVVLEKKRSGIRTTHQEIAGVCKVFFKQLNELYRNNPMDLIAIFRFMGLKVKRPEPSM